MELMAPAGSVEHFTAALEAGADAVYVGAPYLNARNPSKELRFEEIAAMADYARDRDKRLYVALNSLVKEDELSRLIRTLAELEAISPHALIVQDFGVMEVINRYFNTLDVHASTLTFAHSVKDVEMLAAVGCSRVVLARELSLQEIEHIIRNSPVEIEVFVHGAMCFSYSGRCLFSSYHGGKSGLRGDCVQPCRRKFSVSSAGAGTRGGKGGGRSGYLFSMNDLEGLSFLDQFKKIGVASIKIEGRLKPITYVQHVVKAYRLVLDAAPDDRASALEEAHSLLEASLGRRRSTGYFLDSTPTDAIASAHSGNIGTYLGQLSGVTTDATGTWGKVAARVPIKEGDRLRLHFEASGERTSFTVRQFVVKKGGDTAVLLPAKLNRKQLQGKASLYRVDTVTEKKTAAKGTHEPITIKQFSRRHTESVKKRSRSVATALTAGTTSRNETNQGGGRQGRMSSASSELWLKLDSVKPIYQSLPFTADRFVIPINRKTLAEVGHLSRYFGKNRNRIIWALPPVVFDRKDSSLSKDVRVLLRSGFRSFQISTIGQRALFDEKNISLFGDYTLNVLNSMTMRVMMELGLKGVQFSIETDRNSLKNAIGGYRAHPDRPDSGPSTGRHQRSLVGLTVYGAPPLFMSRLNAHNVSYRQKITSPKQEEFVIQKIGAESFTRPQRPFSMLPYRKELESIGVDYLIVDLSGLGTDKKVMQDLSKRIGGIERVAKLSSYNYDGFLQ